MILSGTTQGESIHGRFWQHDKIQPVPLSVAGTEMKELALKIWGEIVDALERDVPGFKDSLRSALV
jgi:hypothetical protein